MSGAVHVGHAVPAWPWALVVAALLLGTYGGAARRVRVRTGRTWRTRRTVAFTGGVASLAIGISPLLADAATTAARAHMAQHVLLGMVAPLGLVLGAPLTLALSVTAVRSRRRATAVLRSAPVRTLTHPLTAGLLHVGGLYAVYLTPLYARTVTDTTAHAVVLLHTLAAGCLFAWALVGPERAGRRPGMACRVGVLVAASAAHGYLAKLLYVRAQSLPPGAPHPAGDLQDAARFMYAAGDVAEVALAVVLFAAWYRRAGRRATPGSPGVHA